MKAFALGAVVGALVCFVAIRVTGPPGTQTPAPTAVPAGDADISTPALQGSGRSDEAAETSEKAVVRERADSQAPSSRPSPENKRCISIDDLTEDDARVLSQRAHQLHLQRERARKDAEPKDASWAYSTEMMIRQHVESNLSSYSTLQLQCRTTFCELSMTGTGGAEEQAIADKVAREIDRQPWSDFAMKTGGAGSDGQTWHIEYEWYRPQTQSERETWLEMRERP